VPGWLEEKVSRLLRTLPKNLRGPISPIDHTAARFVRSEVPREQPLLSALSAFLQLEFRLPVDASDFDESALPAFLRMKIIETKGDEILKIHTSVSDGRRQNAQQSGAELAFSKWVLPPGNNWPGDALPDFITVNDVANTRGYPALVAEKGGVARRVYLSPVDADYAHRKGLARLFRIQQADQVRYVEKRPPLTPTLQMTLSAIDTDFLHDLMDASIVEALTNGTSIRIRDENTFVQRSIQARGELYETVNANAKRLENIVNQREGIVSAIAGLNADFDSVHDLEMQLAFLFRPGFLQILDVFSRYPRYLKAMQLRIQRIRNNAPADLRKMEEIAPFQLRLSERLLACDHIADAHELMEFAMLLEEFRVNRFAPEIKTPQKVSSRRLEDAWQALQ